jgi:hypothetical protein
MAERRVWDAPLAPLAVAVAFATVVFVIVAALNGSPTIALLIGIVIVAIGMVGVRYRDRRA